ncbi:hypothetical protein NDU88_001988 [Pleurodeles waltl]|uniref:Uncharacterized protein n=1 Tax=Pleurodeles waltl TaxID=8319 RepID=A0AAV7U7Z9_PLEWA|nr:hypothetical protein NDU88_001988 [Pleurodeles waltl]
MKLTTPREGVIAEAGLKQDAPPKQEMKDPTSISRKHSRNKRQSWERASAGPATKAPRRICSKLHVANAENNAELIKKNNVGSLKEAETRRCVYGYVTTWDCSEHTVGCMPFFLFEYHRMLDKE